MALRLLLTGTQAPVFMHVRGSAMVELPVTLSFTVAVAQSYFTTSGQVWRYQKESMPPAAGTVNVWETLESPLVGPGAASCAAEGPVCAVEVTEVVPAGVHPDNEPVSNPPL